MDARTSTETRAHDAERLAHFINDVRVAMLTTMSRDGMLHSRPMTLANGDSKETSAAIEVPGRLTFITHARSGVADDIARQPNVGLSMQSRTTQCFMRGRARINSDRRRLGELWSQGHAIWFDGGINDPNAVLLEVDVTHAEYWDASGATGLRFALEAGKAMFSGETLDTARTGVHAELAGPELQLQSRNRNRDQKA
jgi:general stress protein 26